MGIISSEFTYEVYSETKNGNSFIVFNEVLVFLRKLSFEYPDFLGWFDGLFSYGYKLKDDREIIMCRYDGKIVGVIILKKTNEENKICTLRVEKKFRSNGIATELIKRGIEWLEDEKPLITCHCSRNGQFSKLFKYFGFELQEKKIGYYGIFNLEYTYNGSLPEKKIWLNKIEKTDFLNIAMLACNNNIKNVDLVIEQCVRVWIERENNIRKQIRERGEILWGPSFYR